MKFSRAAMVVALLAGPVDPWGNARSTAAPKAATKPVAKTAAKAAPAKPKTGSTTN